MSHKFSIDNGSIRPAKCQGGLDCTVSDSRLNTGLKLVRET